MATTSAPTSRYFSAAARRARIIKRVNTRLNSVQSSSLSSAGEEVLALLAYREAKSRVSSQNVAVTVAVSALLIAILFSSGTAFESVFKSSQTNDHMVSTDQFYALVFGASVWVLFAVMIALVSFVVSSLKAPARSAAFAVESQRSADRTIASLDAQRQQNVNTRPVIALVNINK